MAGHSKFKNIMYRKGAQDAKRSKIFSKLSREITVAARSGLPDPDKNPRLRTAVLAARAENMPKDRIERSIQKAQGPAAGSDYQEVRYEGHATGGVAVIVEALTDNRNRTVSEVRAAFGKHGGTLGETGSVGFAFSRQGVIRYAADTADADGMLEAAAEAGADDVISGADMHEVRTESDTFGAVRDALSEQFGTPTSARLEWVPHTMVPVNEHQARTLFRMIEVLEDNDDVQSVSANLEVSDEVLEKLREST